MGLNKEYTLSGGIIDTVSLLANISLVAPHS